MIVNVYECCIDPDNDGIISNGINLNITRFLPGDKVTLKFEDDSEKILFEATLEWKDFEEMIKRVKDNDVINK